MTAALRLLDDVTWQGAPLPGERPAALLAALVLTPSGVSDTALIEVVWGEDRPVNPTKALQVLVSRVRSQCGAGVLVRHGNGYRLGIAHEDVDALLLGRLLQRAESELAAGDPAQAARLAREALDLTAIDDEHAEGPLAEVRSRARRTALDARRLLGLALARSGREREALEHLRAVHEQPRDDTEVLEALLRAEAVAAGVPVALAHYEDYRARPARPHGRRPVRRAAAAAPGAAGGRRPGPHGHHGTTPRSCSVARPTWPDCGPRCAAAG